MFKKKFTTKRLGEKPEIGNRFLNTTQYLTNEYRNRYRHFDVKKHATLIIVGIPLFVMFIAFFSIIVFSFGLPDVRDLEQYRVSQSTFIYDRNGKELYAIHGDENRESVEIFDKKNNAYEDDECRFKKDLCAISEGYRNIILATIAIEDDQFYNHHGFDGERIAKAIASQFLPNVLNRGGSTITQQYIKNTLLSPEKKLSRKIKELILAIKLERVFNKEEIIELYLNRIPYGNNAYGIELGAKTYFNKHAKDLTLAEAAILASLPNAPTRYSPYGNYRHTKILRSFTEKELSKNPILSEADLEQDEYVRGLLGTVIDFKELSITETETLQKDTTEESVDEAADESTDEVELPKNTKKTPKNTTLGENVVYIKGRTDLVLQRMHDLGYITEEEKESAIEETWDKEFIRARENIIAPHFVLHIREILEKKYGKEIVEQGGLKVYTTLDADLQKEAEEIIASKKEFNAENYDATNMALLSLNRKTGEVVAYVGSADYFDEEIDGSVNMVESYVQPGSSFKPVVYSLAFMKKILQPATILYDVETHFGGHTHTAQNYDGTFAGPMTVRRALGQSRNIPAIKAYYLAGEQQEIIPYAQKLGIEFLDPATEHGSSLALGSAEVKFASLVNAYRTIANYGTRSPTHMITKVENKLGTILEETKIAPLVLQIDASNQNENESETNSAQTSLSDSENPSEEINGHPVKPLPLNEKITGSENVIDPQAAYLITHVLSDTEHRLGPYLTLGGWNNAAKTGTSNKRIINDPLNDNDDKIYPSNLLALGYTTEYVTGVWVGNSDGSVMRRTADGYNVAGPIWKQFMTVAHANITPNYFRMPSSIVKMEVSKASGLLVDPETVPATEVHEDLFASYAVPTEKETKYKKVDIDIKTKKLWTENCPVQNKIEKYFIVHSEIFAEMYPQWEEDVLAWAKKNNSEEIPSESCDSYYRRRNDALPVVQILAPFNFAQVPFSPFQVYALASSPNGIEHVEFYLDETLQFQTKNGPYIGNIRPPRTAKSGEKHTLTVRAFDSYGFSSDSTYEVRFDENLEEIKAPADFQSLHDATIVEQPTERNSAREESNSLVPEIPENTDPAPTSIVE